MDSNPRAPCPRTLPASPSPRKKLQKRRLARALKGSNASGDAERGIAEPPEEEPHTEAVQDWGMVRLPFFSSGSPAFGSSFNLRDMSLNLWVNPGGMRRIVDWPRQHHQYAVACLLDEDSHEPCSAIAELPAELTDGADVSIDKAEPKDNILEQLNSLGQERLDSQCAWRAGCEQNSVCLTRRKQLA